MSDRGYIPLSRTGTTHYDPPPAYTSDVANVPIDTCLQTYAPVQTQLQQQQQSSSNVVVLNQPAQQTCEIRQVVRPNDYFCVTILLFLCCLLSGNVITLLCLFPAVIMSLIASNYNDAGEYHLAKKFGSTACTCNIVVVLFSAVVVLLAAVTAIVILFLIGVLAV